MKPPNSVNGRFEFDRSRLGNSLNFVAMIDNFAWDVEFIRETLRKCSELRCRFRGDLMLGGFSWKFQQR
ncbi:hypothetical protein QG37_03252 [Candidozyma auris]|nr:hypothetical protein QG37_03252 [[Candida] auris]